MDIDMNITKAIQIIIKALKELEWGDEIDSKTMTELSLIDEWCKNVDGD